METFFTSDTHFYHHGIITLCKRPYVDAEAMNEALVTNWNNTVKPDDVVFHLGDVIFSRNLDIVAKLNGTKVLVHGNHDNVEKLTPYFDAVMHYHEMKIEGHKVVMFHYPIEDWNGKFHGSIHLHGHSHGRARNIPNRMDVGVDGFGAKKGYRPVSFKEIIEEMKPVPGQDRY